MPYTIDGADIIVSGAEQNLSGLVGMPGVSVLGGARPLYVFNNPGGRIVVSSGASWLIDAATSECLMFGPDVAEQGTLTIEGTVTVGDSSDTEFRGSKLSLRFTRERPDPGVADMVVHGYLHGYGRSIEHHGLLWLNAAPPAPCIWRDMTFNQLLTQGSQYGRINGPAARMAIRGKCTFGGNGLLLDGPSDFAEFEPTTFLWTSQYVISGVRVNVAGISHARNAAGIYSGWASPEAHCVGTDMQYGVNTDIIIGVGDPPVGSQQLVSLRATIDVTCLDADTGLPLVGATCYVRDTQSGLRRDITAFGISHDLVSDQYLQVTTGAGGSATIVPRIKDITYRDGTRQDDVRFAGGVVPVAAKLYGKRPAAVSVTTTGARPKAARVYLGSDASVSLSAGAAAALAAAATLDDVYDVLHMRSVLLPETAQACETAGTVLDLGGYSLVLDPAAPAVVGISGGVITVKGVGLGAGVKHKAIKSTGTVTATGGAVITAPVTDASGDSYLSFQDIDSWAVYSDPARTAQLGAGTGAQLFRFVYAPGVTYYLKCVAGSTEFAMVATPTGAGDTPVTLSTQALLTTLQVQVAAVKADTGLIKAVSL